jgi:RHS repeat-associated protein
MVPTRKMPSQRKTNSDNLTTGASDLLPERRRRWIRLADVSAAAMTNPVAQHYEYGMWGEPTQTVGTQSADFGYAGYYVHGPSGLNLTTYRAYSPALGRWINRDPIEEDGGVNLYAYVDNDPIDWIDPSGLLFRAPDPIPTPTPTPTPKDDGDDPPPPTPPASGKGKGPGDTPTCRQLCSDAFFRRRNRCWKKYQCGSRRDDCISNAWGKWQQCIDKCKKQGK